MPQTITLLGGKVQHFPKQDCAPPKRLRNPLKTVCGITVRPDPYGINWICGEWAGDLPVSIDWDGRPLCKCCLRIGHGQIIIRKNLHAIALGRKGGKAKGKPKGFAAMPAAEAKRIRSMAAEARKKRKR